MLEHVLKIQPLKEILEFQDWKRGYKTYTKKKYSNHKLNQLSKICKINFTNWKTNKQKFSKLERTNIRKQTISKFILMIINQNILASLLTFSNLQKNFYEKFYTKEATFKTATTEFLSQIPNRKNISNEQFHLCEAKIL